MDSKSAFLGCFNFLTKTRAFRKLTKWSFVQCDSDGTGEVGKDELYAGVLLVHIQLAKYAGPAACYPPSRQVIDQLFDAADDDNSGSIDEEEFAQIVVISCAQITSRILVYYAVIILLVPYLADHLILALLGMEEKMGWKTGHNVLLDFFLQNALTSSVMVRKLISPVMFFLVVPLSFDWIDSFSRNVAQITETSTTGAKKES